MENRDLLCVVMDRSGSFGESKRKVLVNKLGVFLGSGEVGYKEKAYIGFTTVASTYRSMHDLVLNMESGGTYISSGLEVAEAIIRDKKINCYRDEVEFNGLIDIILATDGDNWGEDNYSTLAYIEYLLGMDADVRIFIWDIKVSTYEPSIVRLVREKFTGNDRVIIEQIYHEFRKCLN